MNVPLFPKVTNTYIEAAIQQIRLQIQAGLTIQEIYELMGLTHAEFFLYYQAAKLMEHAQ